MLALDDFLVIPWADARASHHCGWTSVVKRLTPCLLRWDTRSPSCELKSYKTNPGARHGRGCGSSERFWVLSFEELSILRQTTNDKRHRCLKGIHGLMKRNNKHHMKYNECMCFQRYCVVPRSRKKPFSRKMLPIAGVCYDIPGKVLSTVWLFCFSQHGNYLNSTTNV